jgi:hypothetical protein
MRACLALFVVFTAASFWIIGDGSAGWLYALIYFAAIAPGLRVGFVLFGRSHAGGWIAGALIGYTLANLAAWAAIELHHATALGFLTALCVAGVGLWRALMRVQSPLIALPAWTRKSTTSLLAVLILTLVVAVPPLAKIGRLDEDGNRSYRAYFTADFVWHMALTAELKKFDFPVQNPFLKDTDIHYYWTYFAVPAAIAGAGPAVLQDVERCLKLNALLTGLLLMSTIFLATWIVVPRDGPAAAAVALALVASSAEGLSAIAGLWYTHQPMATLKDVNIDAVAAWVLGGYRVDGLQRSIWYVPQHSMAYALGLVAIAGIAAAGSRTDRGTSFLLGCLLAFSVLFSPLVGGICALAYGVAFVADAFRRPSPIAAIVEQVDVLVPVAVAVAWLVSDHMVEGAGGALEFGFARQSLHHPLAALVVSLGPILFFAAAGLWPSRRHPWPPFVPYAALAVVSLLVMYFVRLSIDLSWVGFRTGHLVLVALPALGARFIATRWDDGRRRLVGAVVALTLIGGAPTLAIDEFNAQDIQNRHISPGDFPFTVVLNSRQLAALAWIKHNTPPDAIVQMDPVERGRSTWSLVPSWAERRMAAGLPISLMHMELYDQKSALAHAMYSQSDPEEAWKIARQLGVDYIYEDDVERQNDPGTESFAKAPDRFELVFKQGDVEVYRVK